MSRELKVSECVMMLGTSVEPEQIVAHERRVVGMSFSYSLRQRSCSTGQVCHEPPLQQASEEKNERVQWDVGDPAKISILLLYISHP